MDGGTGRQISKLYNLQRVSEMKLVAKESQTEGYMWDIYYIG